jgi:hypothetical protein
LPFAKQDMEQIFNFEEQVKFVAWESRQRMKNLQGFKEPFNGFYEGLDLWPDGAPEEYYKSLQS